MQSNWIFISWWCGFFTLTPLTCSKESSRSYSPTYPWPLIHQPPTLSILNVAPWEENTLNIFTLHPCDLFASSATPRKQQQQACSNANSSSCALSWIDTRHNQQTDQAIDSGLESYAKIIHFRALWIFLCFFNPSTCEFRICVVNMFGSSISIGKRVKQKTHGKMASKFDWNSQPLKIGLFVFKLNIANLVLAPQKPKQIILK